MATFVLVHGSFHGGWCWEGVSRRLQAAGHVVLAPDMPGMGVDRTPLGEVTLSSLGDHVVAVARTTADKVILVGHSLGGLAISDAAEKAPEAVAGLIYVTALVMANGDAAMDYLGEQLPDGIRLSEDGSALVVDRAFALERYYQNCDEQEADLALARLLPQAVRPFHERLSISTERFGSRPRAYIECLNDKAIPIEFQRALHRAARCEPVLALATGHSPFLEDPDGLCDHLLSIATTFAERGR